MRFVILKERKKHPTKRDEIIRTEWYRSALFFSVFSTNLITSFSLLFIGHNVFFPLNRMQYFIPFSNNSQMVCNFNTQFYRRKTKLLKQLCRPDESIQRKYFIYVLLIYMKGKKFGLVSNVLISSVSMLYKHDMNRKSVCVCVRQWYGRFVSSSVINTETYIQYMEQMLNTIHSFLSFVRRERMNRIRGRCGDTFSKLITIENK